MPQQNLIEHIELDFGEYIVLDIGEEPMLKYQVSIQFYKILENGLDRVCNDV